MKIKDARAFKTIYYPSVRKKGADEEINKMLSNGWRLLSINENPNNSAYIYFVHKKRLRSWNKMTKMSKEEYKMLKRLEGDWKWIARDSGGNHGGYLFAYSEKPYKDYYTKDWRGSFLEWFSIDNRLLQFVQWSDSEPYNIAWLLGEYEEAQYGYFNNELYERFCEENKEVEVKKSTELLKGEIEKEIRMWDGVEGGWSEEAIDKIFNLIDEFLLSEKGSDCDDK